MWRTMISKLLILCLSISGYQFAIAVENCSCPFGEHFTSSINGEELVCADSLLQEFTPVEQFIAQCIGVHLRSESNCLINLYLLDAPNQGANVLSFGMQTALPGASEWYNFEIQEVVLNQGQPYYVLLVCDCPTSVFWSTFASPNGEAYPRGNSYAGGIPIFNSDHLFQIKPRDETTGEAAYKAKNHGGMSISLTSFQQLVPNTIAQIRVDSPATMDLAKFPLNSSVELREAGFSVQISEDINGWSQYSISNLHGVFNSYLWGVNLIDSSQFTELSPGKGSINWNTGAIIFFIPIIVQNPGFEPISAIALGSGSINSSTSITMYPDGIACQIVSGQIPTLSEWMMIATSVLLAGWITFVLVRRKRNSQVAA